MRHFAITGLLACACADAADAGEVTSSTGDASTTGASTSTGAEVVDASGTGETTAGEALPCNGSPLLCDRRLDEVTLPATHNSIAAEDNGFPPINRNQHFGLRRQLDDGIRGLLLDVAEFEGGTWLCHGLCNLAKVPHIDAVNDIGGFLDEHPREVIVIIYQDSAPVEAITADWETAGYADLVVTYDGGEWPTLGALIDADTRVLVTAEVGGPPPAWFHHAWDVVWDTPYTFHSIAELSCAMNRGTPGTGLFLVNHWISTASDLPDEASDVLANAMDVLGPRADECAAQWMHPINLLAVDFYDQGDLFAVVAAHNGV